ncbi:MAG: hypothetical protein F6K14_13255 [Symploca sp. SIO2C1]|nr:hypothetical protein [Symploca sp. SIO2C1]
MTHSSLQLGKIGRRSGGLVALPTASRHFLQCLGEEQLQPVQSSKAFPSADSLEVSSLKLILAIDFLSHGLSDCGVLHRELV